MKNKPPFILYGYNNLSKSKPKISEKYGNPLNLIFSRVPEHILKNSQELKKIVYPNAKITYDIINKNKKPQLIEVKNNMSDSQEKLVSNLNSFKEMLYDYNQEEEELLDNFIEIQDENNIFSHNYKKIQKDKGKFNTGTYLDYDYLIKIASKYATRGIKVPKISSEKSVFSANPLILGGSELEDFIVYNLGDRKKSGIFLKKVENLVRRKETGNFIMNDVERKKFEQLQKNEKPKGYIDPKILIPKLKREIIKLKSACHNVKNLNRFLEKKKDKINKNISINERMINNRSFNNIFDNINNNNKDNTNKITIKKNLSFIKNLNKMNDLNKNNNNIKKNIISSISTRPYLSSKLSSANSQRIISSKADNSNISSATTRKKSIELKFSPLPSPIYHNRINNKNNFSLFNDLFSGKRRNDISIGEENSYKNQRINNIKKDRIFSVNNLGRIKKRNLIAPRSNSSMDLKLRKNLISAKDSEKFEIKNENYYSKEEKSEESELILFKKELEGEGKTSNKSLNINIFDNNFDKITQQIIENNIDKEGKKKKKNEDIKINNLEQKGNKEVESYEKTEKIFNSILGNGYNSRRIKIEIDDFLKSKGYDLSRKILNKDAYINLTKMKKKMTERNFLLEEYNLRGGNFSKNYLSPKQKKILDQNNFFMKKIEDNEYRLKKILLEKNIEKDNSNYES